MIEFYGVSGSFTLRDNLSLEKIKSLIDSTSAIKKETGGGSSQSKKDETNETEEDIDEIINKALIGTPFNKFLHSSLKTNDNAQNFVKDK